MEALIFLPSSKFAFASRKQIPPMVQNQSFPSIANKRCVCIWERHCELGLPWAKRTEQLPTSLPWSQSTFLPSISPYNTGDQLKKKIMHPLREVACFFPGSRGKWQKLNGRDKMWWERGVWLRGQRKKMSWTGSASHMSAHAQWVWIRKLSNGDVRKAVEDRRQSITKSFINTICKEFHIISAV